MERRLQAVRIDRVERAKEQIVKRLRHICPHFSDAEFDEMVQRMAELEIKYSMRGEPQRRFQEPKSSGPSRP